MKEELSDQEKKIFSQLEREKPPEPALEGRIINKLKSEDLIKTTNDMKAYLKWAATVAVIIVAYFLGVYSQQADPVKQEMAYMLILQEGAEFQPGEPTEMFTEYRDWMFSVDEKGIEITGQELKNQAVLVSAGQGIDYLEEAADGRVTGYFVLNAASLDEAIAMARDNPHIKYGGTIQVKEFMIR